jgi:hypothetical protein
VTGKFERFKQRHIEVLMKTIRRKKKRRKEKRGKKR